MSPRPVCAAPSLGAALPASTSGTREPPSSIFCAVSAKLRGSWSFCSTIYRLRQHCEKKKAERWPLPRPSARSQERKAPAHDLSTQRASRPPPGLLLATSPSPCPARALPTPSRALPGKPAPPGCAPPAWFRGSGLRPAALPNSWLGSPARVMCTVWIPELWPLDGGFPRPASSAEWPRASRSLGRLYPPPSLGAPPPYLQRARAFGPRFGAHGLDKSPCPLVWRHRRPWLARPRLPAPMANGREGCGGGSLQLPGKSAGRGKRGADALDPQVQLASC